MKISNSYEWIKHRFEYSLAYIAYSLHFLCVTGSSK